MVTQIICKHVNEQLTRSFARATYRLRIFAAEDVTAGGENNVEGIYTGGYRGPI